MTGMSAGRSQTPIYLTFDDGPDPNWTPQILEVLAAADAQATFFMIGLHALAHVQLARRVAASGHAVGNHTFSHRHPWLLCKAEARQEVAVGARALADVLGFAPRFYRPPHGRRRACMSEQAAEQGESVVLWDLSAVDWGPLGQAERIAARLSKSRGGQVVLMHDGRNQHNRPDELLRVLPGFLASLRARGLVPVALH